jgi:hypothetical protein
MFEVSLYCLVLNFLANTDIVTIVTNNYTNTNTDTTAREHLPEGEISVQLTYSLR